MAGEPSMLGLSRQISQFRCVLAQMRFQKKMVKLIFPEWDRSPHQQAPCHHGVHHLGASWPLQAGRYFKYFEYFESSPVVIIQKVIAKYLQLLQSQRHWKICLSMVLLQNSPRPSYFHLGMGLFLWCSNLKTHDHFAELGKYVLMLPHGTWRIWSPVLEMMHYATYRTTNGSRGSPITSIAVRLFLKSCKPGQG